EFRQMRTCPQCGRTFHDEYNFCLVDGTLLSFLSDDNKTAVLNPARRAIPDSVPTVDSRKPDEPAPTVKVDSSSAQEPPLPTIASFKPKPIIHEPVRNDRNVPLFLFKIALGFCGVVILIAL